MKPMKPIEPIKRIFVKRLRKLTVTVVMVGVVVLLTSQSFLIKEQEIKEAKSRFIQIEHLIDETNADREAVEAEFYADNLRTAAIAAEMIDSRPEILGDYKRLQRLASVLGMDEIWIFDKDGTMFAGVNPDFLGMTFDSGEQMAFFKPMLSNKNLRLTQEISPRTVDGQQFQYSAVWNKSGTIIVEVGTTAEHAMNIMKRLDISYIFSTLRINAEADYYAIDVKTGEITGSTEVDTVGSNLAEIGFDLAAVKDSAEKEHGFFEKINNKQSLCVFTEIDGNYIGRVLPVVSLYGDLLAKCSEMTLMLILWAILFVTMSSRMVDKLVIKNIRHINEKMTLIAAGKLNERVELEDSIEFVDLSAFVNNMVSSLKDRVREQEQIFEIVAEHSQCSILQYDITSHSINDWSGVSNDGSTGPYFAGKEYSEQNLKEDLIVMKESKEAVKAFFDDIHTGVPSGEVKVHVKMPDGQLAWSQCKYSTIFAGGKPVTALISVEDITEAYMHQLSHLRFEQANNENKGDYVGFLQADLTLDYVEKHKSVYATSISFEGATFTEYSENGFGAFDDEHREAASKFYTREKLIDDFNNGVNRLENIWHTSSGKWIKYTADLLRDPISGHIKIFAGTKDITDEYEAQLAITRRADYDAMTGLYRVDVGQSLIKEAINTEGGKGGILISLDLDDLKKINDTFGHDAGNDAITSIASIMKEHFRIDDIIVRAGGDEFIIYLRDAATRSDAVSVSMTSLLQKLSRVFVGKDKDYGIHCSAGCAVEEKGDTYDTLFKRADTALYHVKRNGKNNFAFYEPAMEEENYEFQTQRIMSMGSDQRFNIKEVHLLLESIKVFYDLVLNIDISDNSYFIMGEVDDGVFAKVPTFGRLTDFIGMCEKGLHPDDLDGFMSKLSRDSLIKLYGQGHEKIHTQFRFINNGQYSWAESMTMFYVNDTGNVCNFTLIKWADERVSDLEQLRRQKIMDMSLTANLEYVVVIDVDTGAYSILSRDDRDSHRMPDSGDFKEATAIVCENCISQENWQEYYEGMSIKNVLAEIEASGKDYKYEYVMSDGTLSEAVFTWYEESHCELLMTIRKKTVG